MRKSWLLAQLVLIACEGGSNTKDLGAAQTAPDASLDGASASPSTDASARAVEDARRPDDHEGAHDGARDAEGKPSEAGTFPSASALEAGAPSDSAARPYDAAQEPDTAAIYDGSIAQDAMSPNPVELRSFVYVGGWDWSGAAYPFRAYELDRARGTLSSIGAPIDAGPNPSYVGQSLDGRFLYIANEYQGRAGVTVAAVDTSNGTLRIIDSEPLAGEGSYVFTSIDPSGGYLLAANINAGKAAVYPVTADGTLGAALDIETFGDDAETHSIRVHPSGRWAYAPNKKADQIAQLHFDASTGKLSPNSPQALATTHRGPRHLAFSPDGSLAYVSYETDSVLGVYRVETNGTLTEVQTTSTLPAGFAGANTAAHVLVHPRGGFVYCSNRGHDSIAVFSTGADGRVSLLQHIGTQGKVPRHFDIDSQGELLVVANQGDDGADNGTLTVFSIGANGMLSPLGSPISGLPSPTTASIVTVAKL